MKTHKRLFLLAFTVMLAVGMSSVSGFAAVKANSVKITVPSEKTYTMNVGQKKTFKGKALPSKLTKTIQWSSSKNSVATITSKGVVSAKKNGKTTITAKAGTKSAKVTLTVHTPVKSVKITGSKSVEVGQNISLKAAVSPSSASDKSIKWSSSNTKVASVSSKGTVKGIKAGTAVIKATASNKKSASHTVKVTEPVHPASNDLQKIYKATDVPYAEKITDTLAMEMGDDHMGFITSGSDAELKAADFLEKEFHKIGLQDVEKISVDVDKWQFNDASLTLRDSDGKELLTLTNKDGEVASYASTGTVQQPEKDWKNLEIVDAGQGLKSDYEKFDAKGKIVLAEVDQNSDYWIDGPYTEAAVQGAAAIFTYQSGGYGEFGFSNTTDRSKWDTINMQDLCAEDLKVPCLSISPASADRIKATIKANGDKPIVADLMVDNEIKKDSKSYNVIGKIKGSGNTGQQILYAGHFDKYFHGYQDDASAIGLTAGIAKAMIDANYKPVNDMVFIAHCAEEWGQVGTTTDWAIGSWKLISEAKPEWKGKTLAIIDFESPGIKPSVNYLKMTATRELSTQLAKFGAAGLLEGQENETFFEPMQTGEGDGYTTTDGISYQFSGVPVIYNGTPRGNFYSAVSGEPVSSGKATYHTQYDRKDVTYSPDAMEYKIKGYAATGAFFDSMPALELDMGRRCLALENAMKDNPIATAEQQTAYKSALADLKKSSSAYFDKAKALNDEYVKAYRNKSDQATLDALREKAVKMNTKSLEIFQKSQDYFVGLPNYGEVATYHEGYQWNMELLDEVIAALKAGDQKSVEGAMDVVGDLWSYYEWYAVDFSKETYERAQKTVMNQYLKDRNIKNWGDRMSQILPTFDFTQAMYREYEKEKPDYAKAIAGYQDTRDQLQGMFDKAIDEETKSMKTLTDFINK